MINVSKKTQRHQFENIHDVKNAQGSIIAKHLKPSTSTCNQIVVELSDTSYFGWGGGQKSHPT